MSVGSITALSLNETDQRKINFAIQQLLQRNSGQQINASVTTTSSYAPTSSDFLVNVSGNTTVTLPSAASAPGQLLCIKKDDGYGTKVTVDPGSNTIDGSTAVTISLQYECLLAQSNGTQWDAIISPHKEGNWTPSLTFGAGNTGMVYANQTGTYLKNGNRCHIQMSIVLTSKGTSTGTATIGGLPFSAVGTAQFYAPLASWVNGMDNNGPWQSVVNIGQTVIGVQYLSGGSYAQATSTNFSNTSAIFLSGAYQTT
jgi:hypothetical protein